MKIRILSALLALLHLVACSQNNLGESKNSLPPCVMKDITLGFYPSSYSLLDENSWDSTKLMFNSILDNKGIEIYRKSGLRFSNWYTLMRFRDIKWQINKAAVLKQLDSAFCALISGRGYLNDKNRNILVDDSGCRLSISDPVYLPHTFGWLIISIDPNYGASFLDRNWSSIMIDEPYMEGLRYYLLNIVHSYYKVPDMQLFLDKLHTKYMASMGYEKELDMIGDLREKNNILKTKSQSVVWAELVEKSKSRQYELMSSENLYTWSDNIQFVTDIFDNTLIDINIPLSMAEKEEDLRIKYCLAYCSCGLANQGYPKRLDEQTIKRIDKLVAEIQKNYATLKTGKKGENDFLNLTYQALKKWHK